MARRGVCIGCGVALLVVAGALVVIGVLSGDFAEQQIENRVAAGLKVTPSDAEDAEAWAKLTESNVTNRYFVFNYTNLADMLALGAKPVVQEVGPFTYDTTIFMYNTSFNATRGTFDYNQWHRRVWANRSGDFGNPATVRVTTVNPYYTSLLSGALAAFKPSSQFVAPGFNSGPVLNLATNFTTALSPRESLFFVAALPSVLAVLQQNLFVAFPAAFRISAVGVYLRGVRASLVAGGLTNADVAAQWAALSRFGAPASVALGNAALAGFEVCSTAGNSSACVADATRDLLWNAASPVSLVNDSVTATLWLGVMTHLSGSQSAATAAALQAATAALGAGELAKVAAWLGGLASNAAYGAAVLAPFGVSNYTQLAGRQFGALVTGATVDTSVSAATRARGYHGPEFFAFTNFTPAPDLSLSADQGIFFFTHFTNNATGVATAYLPTGTAVPTPVSMLQDLILFRSALRGAGQSIASSPFATQYGQIGVNDVNKEVFVAYFMDYAAPALLYEGVLRGSDMGLFYTRTIEEVLFGQAIPAAVQSVFGGATALPGVTDRYTSAAQHYALTGAAKTSIFSGEATATNPEGVRYARFYYAYSGVSSFHRVYDLRPSSRDATETACPTVFDNTGCYGHAEEERIAFSSTGGFLGPFRESSPHQSFASYAHDVKRLVEFDNVGPVTFKGIKMHHFRFAERNVLNASLHAANSRYRMTGPSGVMPLSPFVRGAALWASLPHFGMADAQVTSKVTGLQYEEDRHRAEAYVEPLTGAVMYGRSALQLSVRVDATMLDGASHARLFDYISVAAHKFAFLPLFWGEITASISDEDAESFASVYSLRDAVHIAGIVFMAAGALGACAALWCVVRLARSGRRDAVQKLAALSDGGYAGPSSPSGIAKKGFAEAPRDKADPTFKMGTVVPV
jgi:hypothetical protein